MHNYNGFSISSEQSLVDFSGGEQVPSDEGIKPKKQVSLFLDEFSWQHDGPENLDFCI